MENKKQKLASYPSFFKRMFWYICLTTILIILSLIIGVFGYHYIGETSWIDAFHMSSLILTGMGPVIEMKTAAAKLFSSFYALYSGVAFLSITALFMAPIIHRLLHILHLDDKE
ncbi:MAG: hypothetical protein RLZZ198_881 [Bacteroidota bacterium]|jgi:hypothetical protein